MARGASRNSEVPGGGRPSRRRRRDGDGSGEIDTRTLVGWGFEPGPWFKDVIARARGMAARGLHVDEIRTAVAAMEPSVAPPRGRAGPPGGVAARPELGAADDVPVPAARSSARSPGCSSTVSATTLRQPRSMPSDSTALVRS